MTILAREEKAHSLQQNGLVIRHHLQRETTKDAVEAVTDVNCLYLSAMTWHRPKQIDLFYEELLKGYPPDKLKTWNRLRGMMPSWEELHRKYGS